MAGVIGLVFKNYDDKILSLQTREASQPPLAISLAVMYCMAKEIEGYIFTSLTQMNA